MATFEESFLYPLILLLVGAVVSGVLVSWLTNRWQNHRKELDIKVDIASKMSEAIAHQMANAFNSADRKKKTLTDAEEDAYYEDWRKWYVDVSIISSKLESYFPGAAIRLEWNDYHLILQAFSHVSLLYFIEAPAEEEKKSLEYSLKNIRDYVSPLRYPSETLRLQRGISLSKDGFDHGIRERLDIGEVVDPKDVDWDHFLKEMTYDFALWIRISVLLNLRGDEIIRDVLKLPIKVF